MSKIFRKCASVVITNIVHGKALAKCDKAAIASSIWNNGGAYFNKTLKEIISKQEYIGQS